MKSLRQLVLLLLVMATRFNHILSSTITTTQFDLDNGLCLSWRLAVEANNMEPWPTVPTACLFYVKTYMLGGQYDRDVEMVVDQVYEFLSSIVLKDDGKDAWILDVDDTCISNVIYYQRKRFGCDPYDPQGFKSWAIRGTCPAIPQILGVYKTLIETGFKVFLITGRDELLLGPSTTMNLFMQGFVGHEKLMMRNSTHKGQSATIFKSAIRKQLVEEGYRIHGNVGDQWSDLRGECPGTRTFKLPNPMYFVP
ncbi:putative Acid phosphatase [Dioscorea sansibarensis]